MPPFIACRWRAALLPMLWAALAAGAAQAQPAPDTATAAPAATPAAIPAAAPTAGPAASASVPGLLPAALFFRHDDIGAVSLSPGGTRLAVSLTLRDRKVLGVMDLAGSAAPRMVAGFNDVDVNRFHWLSEDRLVFNTIDLASGGGDQPFAPGLFAVDADGSGLTELIHVSERFMQAVPGRRSGREPLGWNSVLLAVPQDGGNEVVVGEREFDGSGTLSHVRPLRLDVTSLRTRSLGTDLPGGVQRWLFDPLGEPRVALAQQAGRVKVYWRAPGQDAWALLADMDALRRDFDPVSVDAQGRLYVATADGADGWQVQKRFDFKTGRPDDSTMVRAAGFDLFPQPLTDGNPRAGGPLLGLRLEADSETTVWFDARLKAWQQQVDGRLPGRINRLTCRRCAGDDPVLLVESGSDRVPGEVWLHRPLAQGDAAWRLIARNRRGVDPAAMASLGFERIRSRDGLDLPVWVTLPASTSAGGNTKTKRPAVVLVHGGPWVRGGHWQWNAEAQFLASRGYVVIEPEFRGSTGYGARHFRAGWQQWGGAMQDDLVDALQWAVGQGWVDASRVCIAGGSYGGYAALMGVLRHPQHFRCAAAWAAVTDPRLMFSLGRLSDISEDARRYSLPQLIGDPVADADKLAAAAPLAQAARIKAPVLLVHGARDRRVPLLQAELLRDALRQAGNPPEWVVYPEEGHGWLREANRIDFGQRLAQFLDRHLK